MQTNKKWKSGQRQTAKQNNQKAYTALTAANVHWDRKGPKKIIVWTPGYNTQAANQIETFLNQYGFRVIGQNFDSVCGKTFTIFSHK